MKESLLFNHIFSHFLLNCISDIALKETFVCLSIYLCVGLSVTNLRSHCHVMKSYVKLFLLLRRFYHVPTKFIFPWFFNIVVHYLYSRFKIFLHSRWVFFLYGLHCCNFRATFSVFILCVFINCEHNYLLE